MPVTIHEFDSRLLVGNPLGDSPRRQIPVYLPEAAAADPTRRFPVVYALAGFTGTGLSFLNYNWYRPGGLPAQLDRLIAGGMPPCIVVMVDGMTVLGGNQYIDSPAVGPWAQHIIEELIPWAERSFPVLPGRAHRAVMGISSGGYGSMMMGLEHPEAFAAIADISGDGYFDYGYLPELPRAFKALRRKGGLGRWLETWRDSPNLPGWAFPAVNIVAMSHFYSPDPSAEHGIQLPFDEETGALRPDIWARWKQRDPLTLVASHAEALKSLRLVYLECGDRDEYHLDIAARLLHRELAAAGVDHRYETHDGGHRGLSYRYETVLPALLPALG